MIEVMRKFAPDKLSEEFFLQYVYEHGEAKIKKMSNLLNKSQKVEFYLRNIVKFSKYPTVKDLQYLLNSHSYFLFAKEETVCLGCLAIISKWQGRIYTGYDEELEEKITEIMSDVILNCYRLKIKSSNTFFDRFFERLLKIANSK